jgi:hypothetical protein
LIVELVYLQVIIMRLKDFGYRDIQVYWGIKSWQEKSY